MDIVAQGAKGKRIGLMLCIQDGVSSLSFVGANKSCDSLFICQPAAQWGYVSHPKAPPLTT
jgi:hypothetical protein